MTKKKSISVKLPEAFYGDGYECVSVACLLADKGFNVALFMTEEAEPCDWTVSATTVYASCDADLETPDGLRRAITLVSNNRFDFLIFAKPTKPELLKTGKNEREIMAMAALTCMELTGRISLLESENEAA
ncbi:hypothetical protein [Pararhizobium sp. DWP3-4]|uniref:hypothetical protein n=1 Tax=Pararhizobium sp. DWP3-4 TaxID=2804565 RepID=UPI003CEC3E61